LSDVLYTDFPLAGKIANPDPVKLARAAVESVKTAKAGMDGISYLMHVGDSGIETALTAQYRTEIFRLTGAADLQQALALLRMS
jgi:hypothetical protein